VYRLHANDNDRDNGVENIALTLGQNMYLLLHQVRARRAPTSRPAFT